MNTVTPPLVDSSTRQGSGIDYLRRIVSGEYAPLPIGETLGFRIASVEPGKVTVRGRPDARSLNLINTIHGGWAAAVLDTAMALSNLSMLAEGQSFTTLDIRINYIRPITLDTGEVVAEGSIINAGRRVAYCEAKLLDSAGKLLAHGTGTCLILPR